MESIESIDFFADQSLVEDPYPYFEALRAECPVLPLPHLGIVAVTGYDEASEVYRDPNTFSSCNSVIGPFATFPVPLEGDDVGAIIDQYRDQLPMSEHMVTMDPPDHTRERALLMRLITPKRLRENEEFMWRLAEQQLDEFVANGRCEFISEFSQPFAMLVVADLLGVPESDHARFREGFGLSGNPGEIGSGAEGQQAGNSLGWLDQAFVEYVEDRRRAPRQDVLTDLALGDLSRRQHARGHRGRAHRRRSSSLRARRRPPACSRPRSSSSRCNPELQDELREHHDRIPNFIEETLRVESPVKADFRLARTNTTIGDVEVPAGTPVMLLNGAANRDPARFECPAEFRADRPNTMDHLAFGRGHHSCPGGPLARAEGRISIERILDRMRDIRLSEEHHGPVSEPRFDYAPTWVLRGLNDLHLEFTPA